MSKRSVLFRQTWREGPDSSLIGVGLVCTLCKAVGDDWDFWKQTIYTLGAPLSTHIFCNNYILFFLPYKDSRF